MSTAWGFPQVLVSREANQRRIPREEGRHPADSQQRLTLDRTHPPVLDRTCPTGGQQGSRPAGESRHGQPPQLHEVGGMMDRGNTGSRTVSEFESGRSTLSLWERVG